MMNKPIIGLTMGDAAGIGPEIIIKAAMNEDLYHTVRIIVIGDTDILFEARKAVRSNILLNPIHGVPEAGFKQGVLDVIEDRKSTRLNSSHIPLSRMPSSA